MKSGSYVVVENLELINDVVVGNSPSPVFVSYFLVFLFSCFPATQAFSHFVHGPCWLQQDVRATQWMITIHRLHGHLLLGRFVGDGVCHHLVR